MTVPIPTLPPRGACPSLEAPMRVSDGLLVRVRPAAGGFTPGAWARLGDAAERWGNGRLELSVRGSLQLRGFDAAGVEALRDHLDTAGIAVATGMGIEHSPLAGQDPDEILDPRPMIATLSPIAARFAPRLGPKVSLLVSAGGRYNLDAQNADIRVTALNSGLWTVAVGGTALTARSLGTASPDAVPDRVAALLSAIADRGRSGRGKHLDVTAAPDAAEAVSRGGQTPELPRPGPLGLKEGGAALAIAWPFGQTRGHALANFARSIDQRARLEAAPHRHLVVFGDADALEGARAAAASVDWWTTPSAPGLRLPLCSGAQTVGTVVVHNADIARMLVDAAPEAFAGDLHLHGATCARGCGFPQARGLRVAAAGNGLALHIHPGADAAPLAWVHGDAIEEGLAGFARQLAESRRPDSIAPPGSWLRAVAEEREP